MTAMVSFTIACYFSRLNKGISSSRVQSVDEIEELRKDHRSMKDLVEVRHRKLFTTKPTFKYRNSLQSSV